MAWMIAFHRETNEVLAHLRRYQEQYDNKTAEPSPEPMMSDVRPVDTEDSPPYDIKEEQIEYLELDESHLLNEDSQGSEDEEQPGTS